MAPRRIIVPLDGSRFAEQALPHAAHVARCSGAHLHLTSVLEVPAVVVPPPVSEMAWAPPPASIAVPMDLPALVKERQRALSGLATRLRHASGCDVSADVLTGNVVAELDAHVRALQADLIVMTTHATGGLSRLLLGSTADALLRHLDVPMLLVKPSDEARWRDPKFRRVLISLDGSPFAERIIDAVTETMECDHPGLVLLHVTEPRSALSLVTLAAPHEMAVDHRDDAAEDSEEYLRRQANRLRAAGWRVGIAAAVRGGVARTIVEHAEQEGADVIAIATHGRGGLRRFVLGSVADKVIQDSPTRVLVATSPA